MQVLDGFCLQLKESGLHVIEAGLRPFILLFRHAIHFDFIQNQFDFLV